MCSVITLSWRVNCENIFSLTISSFKETHTQTQIPWAPLIGIKCNSLCGPTPTPQKSRYPNPILIITCSSPVSN